MKKSFCFAALLIAAFIVWTLLLCTVDVSPIGVGGTKVGFSTLNTAFHSATGVNMLLYTLTDWLGLIPLGVALAYAISGFCQLVRRRSILKVDRSILALGVFYVAVIGVYIFFEYVIVNYRPILIEGIAEASYPSSTTVLTVCVMATALADLRLRISNRRVKACVVAFICAFIGFMVICRLISGVHWVTDIIGGALISAGLVTAYGCALKK